MTTMAEHEAKIDPITLAHSDYLWEIAENMPLGVRRRLRDISIALKYRPDIDMKGDFQFEVGKTYPTRGGRLVTIVRKTDTDGYECVQGDDMTPKSGYRYSRSTATADHGRCTGAEGEDEMNLLPIEITDHRIIGAKHLEERRLLVLSTAHLSEETAKWLTETPCDQWNFTGGLYSEYGFFVYAIDDDPAGSSCKIQKDLQDVMKWARRRGFNNILFDRDAEQVVGLRTWEW
jgi:hypothetical protein